MKIIAIANQKGGCGKTTTAVNLSSALSYKGRKVLLIDLDPQSHAGLSFGIDVEGLEYSIYHVLKEPPGQGMRIDDILIMIRENLFLAPSTVLLCAIEQELSGLPGREFRLTEQIGTLRQTFDYAIIDCPPSIGLLTFNALTASHEVIIPIEASIYSIHGVRRLLDEIELVERNRNRPLFYTIVETMYDHRMKYSRSVYKQLQEQFREKFFPIPIHHTVKVREAAMKGIPLHEFAPDCTAFIDYMEMADSVIVREGALVAEALDAAETSSLAPTLMEEGMKFSIYAPHAKSVQLVGDFNVWNPDEGYMSEDERGVWSITLPLTPGKYNYKFIIDGDWVTDPNNPSSEKDEKGNVNSIVRI
ncbi:MAG: AAA family ATPase [Candidatus Glassbacteria bacterium]